MEAPFEKLLVLLANHDVHFIVVGGVAVALQGYMRMTEDVDILVESSTHNIELLLATLSSYGEGFAQELSIEDFSDEEGAIRIVEETEFCQVDIFTRMNGLNYQNLLQDSDELKLGNTSIRYASKAALIRLKSSSVREKDRLDALVLERLKLADQH